MPATLSTPRRQRTHPLRNALRLDPICVMWIDNAAASRRAGYRRSMRIHAHMAIVRARTVWRRYIHLPPAA